MWATGPRCFSPALPSRSSARSIEILLLRRIYRAPELFQLLATFALTLIVQDVALQLWGSENLVGPRAPGLKGAIFIFGRALPTYDLALILIGPAVLGLLWLLLTRTRWGILIRAATQDRDMVAALGVNQAVLFTGVFALGAGLAALGGALNLPREPANLGEDITAIGDAFVVVVVGGMGSIPGAFLAALLIAEIKALCIALGQVSLLRIHNLVPAIHAGCRVRRDGNRAGAAPLGTARQAAGFGALGRADRGADCAGRTHAAEHRCRGARGAARPAAYCRQRILHHRADDRYSRRRAVRGVAAFHHGAGRHAFLRPCRLFRPWRVRRRPCCSRMPAFRWNWRSSPRRSSVALAHFSSAGSACGCPASTSRC